MRKKALVRSYRTCYHDILGNRQAPETAGEKYNPIPFENEK